MVSPANLDPFCIQFSHDTAAKCLSIENRDIKPALSAPMLHSTLCCPTNATCRMSRPRFWALGPAFTPPLYFTSRW